MTDEERKAWLDFVEKRQRWKDSKKIAMDNAKRFSWLFDFQFCSESSSLRLFYRRHRGHNDFELRERILDAWNARCRAIKLRKESENE